MPKKLIFYFEGLAILKPSTEALDITFISDTGTNPHQLTFWTPTGFSRDIQVESTITIKTDGIVKHKEPPTTLQLHKNILDLDVEHGAPLGFLETPQVPVTKLQFDGAKPYTRAKTKNKYVLQKYNSGNGSPSGGPKEAKKYTNKIRVEMDIYANGSVTVNGVDTSGNDFERKWDFWLIANHSEATFNNVCVDCPEAYNDFHLYYDVLDGEGYEIRVSPESTSASGGPGGTVSLEIACNPVRGGGKS